MNLIILLSACLNLSILSRVGFDTALDKMLFWTTVGVLIVYVIGKIFDFLDVLATLHDLINGEKK